MRFSKEKFHGALATFYLRVLCDSVVNSAAVLKYDYGIIWR